MDKHVSSALSNWMERAGVYVSVDGQYGSTGKGVINGLIGERLGDRISTVFSNAGPNSGHTSFCGDEKIVLKQLPTSAVTAHRMQGPRDNPNVLLTAGAVIDPAILQHEIDQYMDENYVIVHPHAAVIGDVARREDEKNVAAVAGTGMGVGPAIISKMARNVNNVYGKTVQPNSGYDRGMTLAPLHSICFMEVSQGFSLGINSGFYPYVTTRECTVAQAMADAGLSPAMFRSSVMSIRTFPIRVGSTENTSGPCYKDQVEMSWADIGQAPEYTTVTKRVRRVFSFSVEQYMDALAANTPDIVFLNFCNYLSADHLDDFVRENVLQPYLRLFHRPPVILLGFGPKSDDVKLWRA